MSFTIHADKWTTLASLRDESGARVLSKFEYASTSQEKGGAVRVILNALPLDKDNALALDLLHAGNIGLIDQALQPENADTKIEDALATALKNTKGGDFHSTVDSWKDGIFKKAFEAAVEAEDVATQDRALQTFATLGKADRKRANAILKIYNDAGTKKITLVEAVEQRQEALQNRMPEFRPLSPYR